MMIWLLALPVGASLVLLVVGRWRLVAVPVACAVLFAMSVILALVHEPVTALVAGRAVELSPSQAVPLSLGLAMLAITLWATFSVPRQASHMALCIGGVAAFVASLALRNMTLSALALGIGTVFSAMLVPSDVDRSAHVGMQILVQVTLGSMLLVFAGWALEGADAQELPEMTRLGAALYGLGLALLVGMAPFHLTVAPLFQQGNALAILMLRVLLPVIVFCRLLPAIQSGNWPGGEAFFGSLLYWGGLLTVVVGAISAVTHRRLGTALSYVALADLGVVIVCMGQGSGEGMQSGLAHMSAHMVGVTLTCLGLQSIRLVTDQDDLSLLAGVVRRAPWACLAFVAGGLSLAGLPGTAGFGSRYVVYRLIALDARSIALALVVASLFPAWAILSCAVATLKPAVQPDTRREVRWNGLLGLPLVALLWMPYLLAQYPDWLPTAWLRGLIGW